MVKRAEPSVSAPHAGLMRLLLDRRCDAAARGRRATYTARARARALAGSEGPWKSDGAALARRWSVRTACAQSACDAMDRSDDARSSID